MHSEPAAPQPAATQPSAAAEDGSQTDDAPTTPEGLVAAHRTFQAELAAIADGFRAAMAGATVGQEAGADGDPPPGDPRLLELAARRAAATKAAAARRRFAGIAAGGDWSELARAAKAGTGALRAAWVGALLATVATGLNPDPARAKPVWVERGGEAALWLVKEQLDSPAVQAELTGDLATALLLGGSSRAAAPILEQALAGADLELIPKLQLVRGDLLAAGGAIPQAREAWRAAELAHDRAELAASATGRDGVSPAAAAMRSALRLRLDWVGEPAPLVSGEVLSHGSAVSNAAFPDFWAACSGGLRVAHVWATWSDSCRDLLLGWDALHRKLMNGNGAVIGLTRPYANGFLPGSEGAESSLAAGNPGGFVSVDPAQAADHLRRFRSAAGIEHPFALTEASTIASLRLEGLPAAWCCDRQGRVLAVGVGRAGCRFVMAAALQRP